MKVALQLIMIMTIFFLCFFMYCCREKPSNPSVMQIDPAPVETTPIPKEIVAQPQIISSTLGVEAAAASDFTISLYPNGKIVGSGKTKGMSPQDEEIVHSILEMYTIDSIDDVLLYYSRIKRKLLIRDFDTDRGRNVILSDVYGIVLSPGMDCKRGTTLILSRDNKEVKTRMVYTSFFME